MLSLTQKPIAFVLQMATWGRTALLECSTNHHLVQKRFWSVVLIFSIYTIENMVSYLSFKLYQDLKSCTNIGGATLRDRWVIQCTYTGSYLDPSLIYHIWLEKSKKRMDKCWIYNNSLCADPIYISTFLSFPTLSKRRAYQLRSTIGNTLNMILICLSEYILNEYMTQCIAS